MAGTHKSPADRGQICSCILAGDVPCHFMLLLHSSTKAPAVLHCLVCSHTKPQPLRCIYFWPFWLRCCNDPRKVVSCCAVRTCV
jgi:hypothetical protein